MFWRRKKRSSEICSIETKDRRESFRVSPLKGEPVKFSKGNHDHDVQIIDIGAKGISFKYHNQKPGDIININFDLPGQDKTIITKLKIMLIDKKNVCHGSFPEISEESVEMIHKYMLDVQKKEIKGIKGPM